MITSWTSCAASSVRAVPPAYRSPDSDTSLVIPRRIAQHQVFSETLSFFMFLRAFDDSSYVLAREGSQPPGLRPLQAKLSRNSNQILADGFAGSNPKCPGTQSVSRGPPKSPPVCSPPVTPPPPSGRVGGMLQRTSPPFWARESKRAWLSAAPSQASRHCCFARLLWVQKLRCRVFAKLNDMLLDYI
jgi:hypothetical protein